MDRLSKVMLELVELTPIALQAGLRDAILTQYEGAQWCTNHQLVFQGRCFFCYAMKKLGI